MFEILKRKKSRLAIFYFVNKKLKENTENLEID
jgi:hypothetical protein